MPPGCLPGISFRQDGFGRPFYFLTTDMQLSARRRSLLILSIWFPLQMAGTGTVEAPLPARVVIYVDGGMETLETGALDPGQILGQAGVTLHPDDVLMRNGLRISLRELLPQTDPVVLQVQRAHRLSFENEQIVTTEPTVAAALWRSGRRLRLRDAFTPGPETAITGDLQVDYRPAAALTIRAGDLLIRTRSAAQTVGEALQEAGLTLQGLDISLPEPGSPPPADGRIQVVRVEEEILLEQVSLPFETLLQPMPDLEIDSRQVIQAGAFGLQVSRIRVRYEDGVETSRLTEAEWVAAAASPRIIAYGVQIVLRTLDTPDGPLEYWRAVPAFATSYSPCRLGTDFCGNTTASGLPLAKGMVGVIRSWYNAMVFSQVYVPGYGMGVIADIGAGVSGEHWIDLGYSDDDWVSWSQAVTIYFLTPVPPTDQILWILP